jgi:hypothetical protein
MASLNGCWGSAEAQRVALTAGCWCATVHVSAPTATMPQQVDAAAVEPHIPAMMRALLVCCKDMAWPVRDAGCVAAAR